MVVEVCAKGIACEFLGRSVLSDQVPSVDRGTVFDVLMRLLALGAF